MNNRLDNQSKICVIGAGNGGLAAAADLTIRGKDVILFELPEFKNSIIDLKKKGGLYLKTLPSSGLTGGFARLYKITTDIAEALEEAEIILIVAPAFAHEKIAQVCASYLRRSHIVVLAPGNMGGSIAFYNTLIENGCNKDVVVSEMECMMYACRKMNQDTVYIRGYKHHLGFATFPASETEIVFQKVKEIYPFLIKRRNVIETGMSNCNPILHVPILLFNLSLIDHKIDTLMYHEALTLSIGKIIAQLDQERCAINDKCEEVKLTPMKKIIKSWYEHQGATGMSLVDIVGNNPIYYSSKLPTELNHRYITEDVPYGLIPMVSLLNKFEIEGKYMKNLIELACIVTGNDLYENARTLKTLQLQEMRSTEIIDYVTYRN